MKNTTFCAIVFFALTGLLAGCKESSDDSMEVSVPSAGSLVSYTGTLPTNDAAGQAQSVTVLSGIVSSIESDLSASIVSAKKARAKGYNYSEKNPINFNSGNLTVTGEESFSINSNMEENQIESPSTAPAGSYMQFGAGLKVNGKTTGAGYSAVVNSNTYNVQGQFGIKMQATMRTTVVSYPTMSASYSIDLGFGLGFTVSNAAGLGGKFILSITYANALSATYNYTTGAGLDYSAPPANVTATLRVYATTNKLHATYGLTPAQIESIMQYIVDGVVDEF